MIGSDDDGMELSEIALRYTRSETLDENVRAVRTTSSESIPELGGEALGGNSGCFGATINFVNSIVGSGIISLAFAVREMGFGLGLMLLFLVPSLTYFSVKTLIDCGTRSHTYSYEELAEHCFGRYGFYIVSAFMLVFAFGAMCSYLIIVGDTVTYVMFHLTGTEPNRQLTIALFATFIILPLCLLRDMAKLSFSSLISCLADFVMVILIVSQSPHGVEYWTETYPDQPIIAEISFAGPKFFAGLGAMSFAFVCQHSSFIVFNTLKEPSVESWKRVNRASVVSATVMSQILAFGGYLTFYNQTKANVLNNFSPDNLVINIGRFLLALTMVFTFPMEQFVCRHSLYAMIVGYSPEVDGPKSMTNRFHYGLTILLWSLALLIAMLVNDLGFILELTGAFGASFLGYILPSLCFFKLYSFRGTMNQCFGAWRPKSEYYRDNVLKRIGASVTFVSVLFMLIFGIIAMVVGTIETFI